MKSTLSLLGMLILGGCSTGVSPSVTKDVAATDIDGTLAASDPIAAGAQAAVKLAKVRLTNLTGTELEALAVPPVDAFHAGKRVVAEFTEAAFVLGDVVIDLQAGTTPVAMAQGVAEHLLALLSAVPAPADIDLTQADSDYFAAGAGAAVKLAKTRLPLLDSISFSDEVNPSGSFSAAGRHATAAFSDGHHADLGDIELPFAFGPSGPELAFEVGGKIGLKLANLP